MSENLRVLIAEDDEFLSALLEAQCNSIGFHTHVVSNGELAVNAALTYQYDVLLLDIQMPICDGIEAMTLLRQLGYQRPIIAMSAEAVSNEGFDKILLKPLNIEHLSQFLQCATIEPPVELNLSQDLITLFYSNLDEDISQFSYALEQADLEKIARIVHKIKGGAASFGELTLSSEAGKLLQLLHQQSDTALKQRACETFLTTMYQTRKHADV